MVIKECKEHVPGIPRTATTLALEHHQILPHCERAAVPDYVGMAREQDGGCNGIISNYKIYTMITWLGACFTRFEALFCPFRALP